MPRTLNRFIIGVMLASLSASALGREKSVLSTKLSGAGGKAARAGESALLSLTARDPATGYRLNGLRPAIWLVPDDKGGPDCETWINRLAGVPTAPEGVIDLNGYDVVHATRDNALALVDPKLNLASANIKAVSRLRAEISAWALEPGSEHIAIAHKASGDLTIHGVAPFAPEKTLNLGAPITGLMAKDQRFSVGLADGRLVEVTHAGAVAREHRIGQQAVHLAETGKGGLVAISEDGKGAFVSNDGAFVRFDLGQSARGVVFSERADSAYILSRDGRSVFRIGQDTPGIAHAIPLEREASRLLVDPKGERLALQASDNRSFSIIDTQSNRLRWTIDVEDPLIEMMFSDNFLYLAHEKLGGVTRIVFDPLGGPPGVASIAAGARSDAPPFRSALPMITRIPGGGILVASGRERIAYMVAEDGAQAAMSSLPLRAGDTAGIMLRYRGPVEAKEQGLYEARFVPDFGGRYLVVVRLDQPAVVHCAPVSIAGALNPLREPNLDKAPGQAQRAIEPVGTVGSSSDSLDFRLRGVGPTARIVEAIAMRTDGSWRRFLQSRSLGQGLYRLDVRFPASGTFGIFVDIVEQGGSRYTLGTSINVDDDGKGKP
jgi:hypothetical protein